MRTPAIRPVAALLSILLLTACSPAALQTPGATEQTTIPSVTEQTEPSSAPTQPQPQEFTLSFAGDCTIGSDHATYNAANSFIRVVKENYDHPFAAVRHYFENDDLTLVNLEGTFTKYNVPEEKPYRFRADPKYVQVLTAGSVEAVSIANNHSYDYGQRGYDDTKQTLEDAKITYVEHKGTAMYTTASGLKVGIYAVLYTMQESSMKKSIAKLQEEGAELIIASFHWGKEGTYRANATQKKYAHALIDAGVDIVVGHHPHVLQPMEKYGDGIIFYSLGNFAFGGNRNPRDKDSVLVQQTVIRDPDGTVRLGKTELIPVRISSVTNKNDYQPTPYEVGGTAYNRVMSKLNGTYKGKNLDTDSDKETPDETLPAETDPVTPTTPAPTDPKPTEPTPTEPKPTEPKPTEPTPTEPKPTEPKPTEPKPTEPKPTAAPTPDTE